MKKLLALVLALSMLLLLAAGVLAEGGNGYYELGDVMDDFTVTLSDGTVTSLYGMLEEKEMVLINFWATWCGPCRMEFPFMEEAYQEYADKVGIVALSVEMDDTDEVILQFKADNDLPTLPMGRDNGISNRFDFDGIPTSIVVDRFGVICMIEIGSTDAFSQIFEAFTGDGYTESKLLQGTPAPVYTGVWPSAEALNAALNAEGSALAFSFGDPETTWPFLVADDGSAVSSNRGVNKTASVITTTVDVEEGAVLCFDAYVSSEEGYDALLVMVDGVVAKACSGEMEWTEVIVPLKKAGEKEITISFYKDDMEAGGEDMAAIKNFRLVTGDAAAAALAAQPSLPQTLSGNDMQLIILNENAKEIICDDPTGALREDFPYKTYIINDAELFVKILIGEALYPELCLLGDTESGIIPMSMLECDDEGMLAVMPIYGVADDGFGVNFVDLYSSRYGDYNSLSYIFFLGEEDANYFAKYMFRIPDVYWYYADGTMPSTDVCAEPPTEELDLPEGYALYDIYFVDEDDYLIDGVIVQVCDDTTCELMVSEGGMVEFVSVQYPYEIHILKVPEGYAEVTESFTLPAEGNAFDPLLIELTR